MKDLNELNLEIEIIKKDIQIIKNNHLYHIEKDMRDVKVEVFRFKYVVYGAIIVLALFGILIVLSQGSAVAPFIYTIF